MKVKCAWCGFETDVEIPHHASCSPTRRSRKIEKHVKLPDVWICDVHLQVRNDGDQISRTFNANDST